MKTKQLGLPKRLQSSFGFVTLALVTVMMSACGKPNVAGKFTGTEIVSQGSGYSSTQSVTLELNQNGDQVSGSYYAPTAQGSLNASMNSSGTIENINLTLIAVTPAAQTPGTGITGSYGASCPGMYTGTLNVSRDNNSINGSLTQSASTNSYCYGTVTRMLNVTKQ